MLPYVWSLKTLFLAKANHRDHKLCLYEISVYIKYPEMSRIEKSIYKVY